MFFVYSPNSCCTLSVIAGRVLGAICPAVNRGQLGFSGGGRTDYTSSVQRSRWRGSLVAQSDHGCRASQLLDFSAARDCK